jgi:hypothetical protein
MSEPRDPLEQLLELAVYAPVGLFLLAREHVPNAIERGRTQVTGQVRLARFIGQFAVGKVRQEIDARLAVRQATTTDLTDATAETEPAAAHDTVGTSVSSEDLEVLITVDEIGTVAPLPIDGYDALAASQVLPRLVALDGTGLEAVRQYEESHRNRRTVLARIGQLQRSVV